MEHTLKNPLKTAIIAGNHKILSNGEIIFDASSLDYARKLHASVSRAYLMCLLDSKTSPMSFMSRISKEMLIKKQDLSPGVAIQLPGVEFVVFESTIKNWANRSRSKTNFCSILGQNSYKDIGETKVCTCWGLLTLTILRLFEKYEFEKVILVSSPKSAQLKVPDVLKTKMFLRDDPRFELIWVK